MFRMFSNVIFQYIYIYICTHNWYINSVWLRIAVYTNCNCKRILTDPWKGPGFIIIAALQVVLVLLSAMPGAS